MKNNKKLTAFSLIEVIISLVIISIIMIALIPVMTKKANKPAFVSGNGSIRECSTDAVENCEYCIIDKCVICKPGYALVETGGERKCVECNICGTPTPTPTPTPEPTPTPTPEPTPTPTPTPGVSTGGGGSMNIMTIETDMNGRVISCEPGCNNLVGTINNDIPHGHTGAFYINTSIGKPVYTAVSYGDAYRNSEQGREQLQNYSQSLGSCIASKSCDTSKIIQKQEDYFHNAINTANENARIRTTSSIVDKMNSRVQVKVNTRNR